ncbi:HAD family hydrolase [Desulfogranum marinum]|uniref:HAD family hydrolase n=1 Tax=Desulfogranum marinum TaxID=453220 RepID=UPI0019622B98|nr:HAD family hydrolase [Desulfogranum marinum]MBM9510881.1 HAD family hydrolase [Desulfogranum marinum]
MRGSAAERRLLHRLLTPLPIVPTKHAVSFFPANAKVIVFDIYGTLLSSAAGDVGADAASANQFSFREALVDAGFLMQQKKTSYLPEGVLEETVQMVRRQRQAEGVVYPEIDILDIWHRVVERLGFTEFSASMLRLAALSYECRVNPVWPMPGLAEVLSILSRSDVLVGVLSNAQFYTPLLLEMVLEQPLAKAGFDEELLIWSYQEKRGKPAVELFTEMNRRLEHKGIAAEDVLYVGNDMRKDIYPANRAGWQTVLFAGDSRSLRLWPDDLALSDEHPDMVINALSQLVAILT